MKLVNTRSLRHNNSMECFEEEWVWGKRSKVWSWWQFSTTLPQNAKKPKGSILSYLLRLPQLSESYSGSRVYKKRDSSVEFRLFSKYRISTGLSSFLLFYFFILLFSQFSIQKFSFFCFVCWKILCHNTYKYIII